MEKIKLNKMNRNYIRLAAILFFSLITISFISANQWIYLSGNDPIVTNNPDNLGGYMHTAIYNSCNNCPEYQRVNSCIGCTPIFLNTAPTFLRLCQRNDNYILVAQGGSQCQREDNTGNFYTTNLCHPNLIYYGGIY